MQGKHIELVIEQDELRLLHQCTSKQWKGVKVDIEAMLAPEWKNYGLCVILSVNILDRLDLDFDLQNCLRLRLRSLIQAQGWYSGNNTFPFAEPDYTYIDSLNEWKSEEDTEACIQARAAMHCYSREKKWDITTVYGQRRHFITGQILELVDMFIEYLQKREADYGDERRV